MVKESFAKNIHRLRKAKKWSQQKLADVAEVSYQTVFRAEAGAMPRIENLQKISRALGVSESELLGQTPINQKASLTPETLEAIKEATKEALKDSLNESGSSLSPAELRLLGLVRQLGPNELESLIKTVELMIPASSDKSKVTPPKIR